MRNCILFILLLNLLPTAYAKRYALIIGNSNYAGGLGILKNPVNDAADMAVLLKEKKFNVSVLKNATKRQMKEAIHSFTRHLMQQEAIGLFFFAGHGIEVGGRNYLIPVDAKIQGEADVEYESIDAGRVMKAMEYAGNNLNMVILDACRNNPYVRSFRSASQGLISMDPPKGSLILYATSPGEIASDGGGRNGLFTQHLLKAIDTPNLTVENVFKITANGVYKATGKKQLPWQQGVILGEFYFSGSAAIVNTTIKPENNKAEIVFWTSIQNENDAAYFESYLQQYPNGLYVSLARLKINQTSLSAQKQPTSKVQNRKLPKMITIPKGSFQMGSPAGERDREDDERQHLVRVSKFQMAEKAVTVGQFREFILATEYRTDAEKNIQKKGCYAYSNSENNWDWRAEYYWDKVGFSQTDQHPVVCVSWFDSQKYISWLNQNSEGGYRLPTEAEWEYAARADSTSRFFWGEQIDEKACRYANVNDKNWANGFLCDDSYEFTSPVGQYLANKFNLFDMTGNVWEWTCSEYDKGYTGGENKCLGKNSANNDSLLVLRGSSFASFPRGLRSASRAWREPWKRDFNSGFRLARTF